VPGLGGAYWQGVFRADACLLFAVRGCAKGEGREAQETPCLSKGQVVGAIFSGSFLLGMQKK
jgi:hypothetical protein